MRTYLSFFFVLLLAATQCQAQLLWEISGKGLETPSYLFGTVHLGDPRAYEFHPEVMPALERAEGMAGELVFEPSMIFQLLDKIMMQDSTLKDLLTEAEYVQVHEKLNEKLGMMAPMAERMKPVFVASMLIEPETSDSASAEPAREPLDLFFQNEARKNDKEVLGLETLEEQMEAFDAIPLRDQAKMLYQMVAQVQNDSSEVSIETLLTLYQKEDLEGLYQMTKTEMSAGLSDKMLTQRNERMSQRLIKLMERKSWFVAVGAAHLPGQDGLIQLLRDEGYTLRPLSERKD